MNQVLLLNLVFYLCPYVAMLMYDISSRLSERTTRSLSAVLSLGLAITFLYSLTLFAIYKFRYGRDIILFRYVPAYLVVFYAVSTMVCMTSLYLKGHTYYNSLIFGFLVAYISSFYWELPENIFWQIKRGYHPTILFVLVTAFPYIWLNKNLGWKKNKKNLILVLLGLATTTYGVLTMPSGIYTTTSGTIYFLFCRAVCLMVMIKIFIFDQGRNKSEC